MRNYVVLIAILGCFGVSAHAQDSIDARAQAQLARDTAAKQPPVAADTVKAAKVAPPPERPAQLELVALKGFAGRLEAVVAVNGRRSTVTMRTPMLPEGWTLTNIGPECAEVKKTGTKPETRALCFIAPAPPPAAAPAGSTAAAPSNGAMPPLPPGVPLTR